MNKCVLGIDLGTSSVKVVKKYEDGRIEKLKNTYMEPLPQGWWKAILELLEQVIWEEVAAIGLSSQVGTYLINEEYVIGWNNDAGKEELKWWKASDRSSRQGATPRRHGGSPFPRRFSSAFCSCRKKPFRLPKSSLKKPGKQSSQSNNLSAYCPFGKNHLLNKKNLTKKRKSTKKANLPLCSG